jgi:hypothetical protein
MSTSDRSGHPRTGVVAVRSFKTFDTGSTSYQALGHRKRIGCFDDQLIRNRDTIAPRRELKLSNGSLRCRHYPNWLSSQSPRKSHAWPVRIMPIFPAIRRIALSLRPHRLFPRDS